MADLAPESADAAAAAVTLRMVGGSVRIYDGRAMLAELPVEAVTPAENGTVSIAIREADAVANGVARKFAIVDRTGAPIAVGTIGTSKRADMLINQRGIEAGAEVRIASMTYTQETG